MKKYISLFPIVIVILLYDHLACSNSYEDLISEESHQISILMSKKIETMTDAEILKIINRAESNIRLIVLFDIQEEGGADYQLGNYITHLYEKKRWQPLIMILKSCPYYPQSTPWIINNFANMDTKIIQIREKIWNLEKEYYRNVQQVRELIENAEQKLSSERKKGAR